MPEIVANGVKLHVQRLRPRRPVPTATVVFVHGLVIDNLSSFYYTLASPVVDAGCEAVLYDLRGHGRSERPPTGYGLDDGVADLDALLDALGIHHPVYLLGNSFGAILATRMAMLRPDRVAGLILVEGQCVTEGAAAWVEDMANSLTVGAMGLERQPIPRVTRMSQRKFVKFLHASDALLNRTTIIDDLALTPPIPARVLESIECPVLAAYGERSELLGAVDVLRRHVPDLTVEIFPGLAHTLLADGTDDLRDLIVGWLDRVAPPALAAAAVG